jgi:hypothetical protein
VKRYRVVNMHFDTTANVLGMLDPKIQDDWPQATKDLAIRNRDQLRAGLVASYGNGHFEVKLANLRDIGMLPFSVIAFHNNFLEQARHAFVMGLYYPALTATCALGERVLNHLVLLLRDDHRETPEYAKVAKKESFDNWHVSVEVLSAWGVFLPLVAAAFKKLERLRHQAIHFDPSIDADPRTPALAAIRLFQEIVQGQFSSQRIRKRVEGWRFGMMSCRGRAITEGRAPSRPRRNDPSATRRRRRSTREGRHEYAALRTAGARRAARARFRSRRALPPPQCPPAHAAQHRPDRSGARTSRVLKGRAIGRAPMIPVMISSDTDRHLIDAIVADASIGAALVKRERVTGGTEVATALVTLTPVVLAALVKILHDKWAAESRISIEAKGVKLKGVSAADAEKLLKQLLEKPRAGK